MSFKEGITHVIYGLLPQRTKLVILDSYFPNPISGFKINEFNYLLDQFPGSEVYSTWDGFTAEINQYFSKYPQYRGRVKAFSSKKLFFAKLFYISFLHNTYDFLPVIERERTPFVFALYGGGQFGLNYPESDAKLRAVCQSPWFRKVIVSQIITAKYLVEKGFTTVDKVELLYGSSPSENLTQKRYLQAKKKFFPQDKKTFDVCFVARRQTPQGKDKGYHLFIAAAKKLAQEFPQMRFHVAGNFDATTIPVGALKQKIAFYGMLPLESLPKFFEDKDIYLSPNIPNQIHPGSFEGITGTCQEAAISGTAVFCSDVLKLNLYFTSKKDIVIITPRVTEIVADVRYYYKHLTELYALSRKGQQKFLEVFDFKQYVGQKRKILQSVLSTS